MLKIRVRVLSLAIGTAGLAALGSATTFSNFSASGNLSGGTAFTSSGNSISITTPNAIVGNLGLTTLSNGNVSFQYDATGGSIGGANIAAVVNTPLGAIFGDGSIHVVEDIYELDSMGNVVGGSIGHLDQLINGSTSTWSQTITLSHSVQNIRAVKSFDLNAPDGNDVNLAALNLVNQSLTPVPEPASFLPLGLGALVLLRRRRN